MLTTKPTTVPAVKPAEKFSLIEVCPGCCDRTGRARWMSSKLLSAGSHRIGHDLSEARPWPQGQTKTKANTIFRNIFRRRFLSNPRLIEAEGCAQEPQDVRRNLPSPYIPGGLNFSIDFPARSQLLISNRNNTKVAPISP